jgi:hypothetical protein
MHACPEFRIEIDDRDLLFFFEKSTGLVSANRAARCNENLELITGSR